MCGARRGGVFAHAIWPRYVPATSFQRQAPHGVGVWGNGQMGPPAWGQQVFTRRAHASRAAVALQKGQSRRAGDVRDQGSRRREAMATCKQRFGGRVKMQRGRGQECPGPHSGSHQASDQDRSVAKCGKATAVWRLPRLSYFSVDPGQQVRIAMKDPLEAVPEFQEKWGRFFFWRQGFYCPPYRTAMLGT